MPWVFDYTISIKHHILYTGILNSILFICSFEILSGVLFLVKMRFSNIIIKMFHNTITFISWYKIHYDFCGKGVLMIIGS